MNKKELLEILKDLPDYTEINYVDPNFGGRGDDLDKWSIKIENGEVFLDCPYWEPVD